jgi:hypothetical protein
MHGEEGLLGQINVWVNQLSNWRKKRRKEKKNFVRRPSKFIGGGGASCAVGVP